MTGTGVSVATQTTGNGRELEVFMRINKKLLLSFLFAFVLGLAFVPVCPDAVWAAKPKTETVQYIDEDGVVQPQECICITDYIEKFDKNLESEWYVVDDNCIVNETITISGDVKLVLKDGKKLTVTGTGTGASGGAGINVGPTNSLTIYGQSGGSGILEAIGNNGGAGIGGAFGGNSCGSVTINGGVVTATGGTVSSTGLGAAGIGGGANVGSPGGTGGDVTINGGKVTATGGGYSSAFGPGIGGGVASGAARGGDGTLTVRDNIVVKAGKTPNPTSVKAHGSGGSIDLKSHEQYYTAMVGADPVTPESDSIKASGATIYRVVILASGDDYICFRQGKEPDEREYIDYDSEEFNLTEEDAKMHYITLTKGENSRFLQGFVCHSLKGYLQDLALQDLEEKTVVFDNLDTTYEIHLVSSSEFQAVWNK